MPEAVSFSEVLTAFKNAEHPGKKAKFITMADDEHIEMSIDENGEKALFIYSKRNGVVKHYRPSNKALFNDDWILFD